MKFTTYVASPNDIEITIAMTATAKEWNQIVSTIDKGLYSMAKYGPMKIVPSSDPNVKFQKIVKKSIGRVEGILKAEETKL